MVYFKFSHCLNHPEKVLVICFYFLMRLLLIKITSPCEHSLLCYYQRFKLWLKLQIKKCHANMAILEGGVAEGAFGRSRGLVKSVYHCSCMLLIAPENMEILELCPQHEIIFALKRLISLRNKEKKKKRKFWAGKRVSMLLMRIRADLKSHPF